MLSAFHILLYLILFFSLIVHGNKARDIWFNFSIFIIVVFAGMRNPDGFSDLGTYEDLFICRDVEDLSVNADNMNIGYLLLSNTFSTFGFDFQFFLFIVALVIVLLYSQTIRLYSPNKLLSILLYLLVSFLMSLAALRQYIAVSICVYSYKFVIERKQREFLITYLIACSFHTTALIILPIYYIYGMETSKRNIFFLLALSVLMLLFMKLISLYIMYFSTYYSGYIERETESTWGRLIMILYLLLIYIYALKRDVLKKNINYLLLLCFVANIILYAGGNGIYGLYRIRAYFDISEVIGIPIILSYIKRKSTFPKLVIRSMIIAYIVALFWSYSNLIEDGNLVGKPYSVFMNKR